MAAGISRLKPSRNTVQFSSVPICPSTDLLCFRLPLPYGDPRITFWSYHSLKQKGGGSTWPTSSNTRSSNKHSFSASKGQYRLIRAIVAHHLAVDPAHCNVSPPEYWRHGSFNVCVPARVNAPDRGQPSFVMVRFPLPYRIGEITRPGNTDEKLGCEAATYAWLQEHCASVPIPHLYGVGLATGQQVLVAYHSTLRAR